MTRAGASALDEYHRRATRSGRLRRRSRALAAVAGAAAGVAGAARFDLLAGRWTVAALVTAGVALVVAGVGRLRVDPDPERWRRGAEGEEATADELAGLSNRRWYVRHDLPVPDRQSRANVDHLVIGRTGVWVVDTKTTRSVVSVRWGRVRMGDRRLDTGPLRWEADVVADALDVDVRPIVAVHGAGLRRRGARSAGVPVLPADRLRRRIRRGRTRLRRGEVRAVAARAEEAFGPSALPGWELDD